MPDLSMPLEQFRRQRDAWAEQVRGWDEKNGATVRHDPDGGPGSVRWPLNTQVIVDQYGGWIPIANGSYECTCPRCRGGIEMHGTYPRFCPYCGEPFGADYGGWRFIQDRHED
jgi:hypothetical protein